MVGRSGRIGERLRLPIASARSCPLLMWPSVGGRLLKIIERWPPMTSLIAGLAPRNGTCVILIPAMVANSAPAR